MKRGSASLRQTWLDEFFKRTTGERDGGALLTAPSALPSRPRKTAVTSHEGRVTASDYKREFDTVSDASPHSSTSSTAPSRDGRKKRRKSQSDALDGRRSTEHTIGEPERRSLSHPAQSSAQTSTDAIERGLPKPAQTSLFRPAAHAIFLSAPESNEQKTASNALPYGRRSLILPWSARNWCEGDGGQSCQAWTIIAHILRENAPNSTSQLCSQLQALLVHFPGAHMSRTFSFQSLADTIDEALSADERAHFFVNVLPWMKQVTCAAPELFGSKRVPLLRQGVTGRLTLRTDEAVALMCCAFFSVFPGRSSRNSALLSRAVTEGGVDGRTWSRGGDGLPNFGVSTRLAPINFDSLFSATARLGSRHAHQSKIRCLLQYFIASHQAAGETQKQTAIEITRVSYDRMPDFKQSNAPLQPVTLKRTGLIEDESYSLQVDFANKVIGGGVLGQGCVQEEIRFVISPELLLSRLVCESLKDNEAVFISGCGQFSSYTGYSSTFRFEKPLMPSCVRKTGVQSCSSVPDLPKSSTEPIRTVASSLRSRLPIRDVCVVTMDAVDFNGYHRHTEDQYDSAWVRREMQKAFVCFYGAPEEFAVLRSVREGPIATGNWGCGAFGGDVELKLLIQWCAASEAGRPINYYIFDQNRLPDAFAPVHARLSGEGWTVGDVVNALSTYAGFRNSEVARRNTTQASLSGAPVEPPTTQVKDIFSYLLTAARQ